MPTPSDPLRSDLAAGLAGVVAAAPAALGVAVRADDGWAWDHDAERVVPSASTIKVPVLLTVLALVEQGRLKLHDEVTLPPADERVGGAGPLSLLPSVGALPLLEALRLMIALSDNDATNAVIEHAGLLRGRAADTSAPVAALLAAVPTRHTRLRRRLMDVTAAARGRKNETCAADLADLLVALRQGRLLGPDGMQTALEILQTQQVLDGLPGFLPPEVLVAAKPGDLPGLRTEVALLERRGRWAVVAVAADGLLIDGADRGTALLPTFAALGELTAGLL